MSLFNHWYNDNNIILSARSNHNFKLGGGGLRLSHTAVSMASEPENGRDIIKAEELPRPLEILKYRDPQNASNAETKFYVLGTAHVSMQSCRDAADLIARVRPDFVLLELCNERISILSLDKFEVGLWGALRHAVQSLGGLIIARYTTAAMQGSEDSWWRCEYYPPKPTGTKFRGSRCCDTVRKEHALPGPVLLVASQSGNQP